MADWDWYPRYFDAYAEDTRHLTTLEHGAYNLLIDEYYRTRKPLPDNEAALANIAKMHPNDWARISPTIRAFFSSRKGWLHQKKANNQLDIQDKKAKKRSEKAQKAALVRHGKIKGLLATSKGQACAKDAQAMLGDATGTGTGRKIDISIGDTVSKPSIGHDHKNGNGHDLNLSPLKPLPGANGQTYSKAQKHEAFEQRTLQFALAHYSQDQYAELVRLQLSDDPRDKRKRKAAFNEADADYQARKAAGTLRRTPQFDGRHDA